VLAGWGPAALVALLLVVLAWRSQQ